MAGGTPQRAESERAGALADLAHFSASAGRAFRGAGTGLVRACAVAAQGAMRGGGFAGAAARADLFARAWLRSPSAAFAARVRASAGAGAAPAARSLHFALGNTSSGEAAARQQRYLERDFACVASFGTIHDEFDERVRVWTAIGERVRHARGWVEFGSDLDPALRRAVVGAMRRAPFFRGLEPQDVQAFLRDPAAARPHRVRMSDPQVHRALAGWVLERADALGVPRARGGLPAGLALRAPRTSIVQRRLNMELPHELGLEDQRSVLSAWCEWALGSEGASWHAVIHQPELGNDARNVHAHVVFAPIPLRREASGFRFERDRRLPAVLTLSRSLSDRTRAAPRGAHELIAGWRRHYALLLNEALARRAIAKRYDHRSLALRGVGRPPERYLGVARSRRESSDVVPSAGESWSALYALGAQDVGSPDTARARAQALEWVRLEAGLVEEGYAPGSTVIETLRAAGGRGVASAEVAGSLGQAFARHYGHSRALWARLWQGVESSGLPRAVLSVHAMRLVDAFGGPAHVAGVVRGAATDPALRRMLRLGGEGRLAVEAVRARARDVLSRAPEAPGRAFEVVRVAGAVGEMGVARAVALGEGLAASLVDALGPARRRSAALRSLRRRAVAEVARAPSSVEARRAAAQWMRRHRRFLQSEAARGERAGVERRLAAMVQGVELREALEAELVRRDGAGLRTLLRGVSFPDGARWLGRRVRAGVLAAAQRVRSPALAAQGLRAVALARRAVDDPRQSRRFEALAQLEAAPAVADALRLVDPMLAERVDVARRRFDARRRALARIVPFDADPAGLGVATALRALGRDSGLLAHCAPALVARARVLVRGYVRGLRRRADAIEASQQPQARDAALGALCAPADLEALAAFDRRLVARLRSAQARARRHRREEARRRRQGLALVPSEPSPTVAPSPASASAVPGFSLPDPSLPGAGAFASEASASLAVLEREAREARVELEVAPLRPVRRSRGGRER